MPIVVCLTLAVVTKKNSARPYVSTSLALLVAYIDDAIGRFEGLRSRVHSLTPACLQQGDALTRLPLICHSMATAFRDVIVLSLRAIAFSAQDKIRA